MSGVEITRYATELRGYLADAGAGAGELDVLSAAATRLAALAEPSAGAVTRAQWTLAQTEWENARDTFGARFAEALMGPLAAIPGLAALVSDLGKLATEGIHGELDLGPVHLEIASSTLVIQPPMFSDLADIPPTVTIGPYRVDRIAARLSSPFGGGAGLPGGGSLLRLPDASGHGGYGGTLELPLGPVQVSASAVIALIDGQPTFLAILGAGFIPPIQLSFGFSLDRVGGIVGVNRRSDADALRGAVRTGIAGDVLFAIRPPSSPLALVTAADRLFPAHIGTHLLGPSLKLSWLSFGPAGSLLGLDLAVIVEIPTGRVAVLGVARVAIPGLEAMLNLRLDLLGLLDPVEQLVSIDASLVDSHVLGIFEVYGDAAMRFSWGSQGYFVIAVGGVFPGFNPEPARLPALRRIGLALDNPVPIITIRSEGYFAITTNSVQFGGRLEIGISLGIEAHGFVQLDALVQFRPFRFEAGIAAGFEISVDGFSFASVALNGVISGPGPIVIRGSLRIRLFIFSLTWNETFTLGSGPPDVLPTPPPLLELLARELERPENVQSASIADPEVLLQPRPATAEFAAVPPTGTLRISQHRAPLGFLIDRVDGRPLGSPQGVRLSSGAQPVIELFSPGSYITLTQSEGLSRPPYDALTAGQLLSPADPPLAADRTEDGRQVRQIVIIGQRILGEREGVDGKLISLVGMSALVSAAGQEPALGTPTPMIIATTEQWIATNSAAAFSSATAAHQFARYQGGVALASTDAAMPLNLAGL